MSAQNVQEAMAAWANGLTVGEVKAQFPELSDPTIFAIASVWWYNRTIIADTIWQATRNLADDTKAAVIREEVLRLHDNQ